MRRGVELLYVDLLSFELYNRSFIVVHITVVGSREDSDDHRESLFLVPFMHFISFKLCLMSSDHREKVVLLEEFTHCLLPKEVRASSHLVYFKKLITRPTIILYRVRPQEVAKETVSRGFLHSLNFIEVVQGFEVWRDAPVYR
jgi:hypothetical protein